MLLGPKIIRTEAHALRTSPALKADVARTIAFYRRCVRALATLAMTHWPQLQSLDALQKPMALEALFHPTAKRPVVRYAVLGKMLGKMPSYLRRAAISHALGAVSSFMANYELWLDDSARERGARPPRLGFSNVFPSLYGGNMMEVGVEPAARLAMDKTKAEKSKAKQKKFELEFVGPRTPEDMALRAGKKFVWKSQAKKQEGALLPGFVRIKLLGDKGLWRFSEPMKLHGKPKRLPASGAMDLSPSLMQRGAKVWLGCPVEFRPPRYLTNPQFKKKTVDGQAQRVCAIDVGINTAATAAIVDATGTVIARKFLTCGRHNDQRDKLQAMIRLKQVQSGGTVKGEAFASSLHRRIEGLNLDAARVLASEIAAFAFDHGAKALVVEDLKGWKPKGPSKAMRPRFHRFQHRMLVQALTHKAQELGLRLLEIHARGTSRWAYDGSGKVKRDKANAQNATFANGRQYNADLNAAYNIAARGLAMILGLKNPRDNEKSEKDLSAETGQSSGSASRMPMVLADVWTHCKLQSLPACKPLSGKHNPASLAVVCQ